jgi:hypothetical protein
MKDFKEPILILVGLFILLGFAYSPLKKIQSEPKVKGDSISSIGSENVINSSNQNTEISPEQNLKNAEKSLQKLQKDVNNKITESKRSPYYNKIRMSNISGLGDVNPDREYLSLSTNLKVNEKVNITGWYLKSEITGYGVVVGKAALLPFPFTKTESDIILQNGDKVYLNKGFSPVGISFRTNKCTGYFEEDRTFIPSLYLECPKPKDENLPTFSNIYDRNEECLNIIDRIQRCRTVDSEFIRDLPDTVSSSCKDYITTQINYSTCVANHLSDIDFPGSEYRVYFSKFGPLWRDRSDKINLYDNNNLIVDSISY